MCALYKSKQDTAEDIYITSCKNFKTEFKRVIRDMKGLLTVSWILLPTRFKQLATLLLRYTTEKHTHTWVGGMLPIIPFLCSCSSAPP